MRNSTHLVIIVFAFASSFLHYSAAAVEVVTVPVGNAGNLSFSTGFGAVNYDYRIGKFEVTNTEYAEFLNHVDLTGANPLALYDSRMTTDVNGGILQDLGAAVGAKYASKPGYGQKPTTWVSWYDSLRFANWLDNGQGAGDTETGAYTLLGGTPIPTNATTISRNPNVRWALASEDEWVKAAYHKNDGPTDNYFFHPNSSNSRSYSDQPPGNDAPDITRAANIYLNDFIANDYNDGYAVTGTIPFPAVTGLTDVGSYDQTVTPYGAYDMSGNLVEWNEAILRLIGSEPLPGIRGDSYWTSSFGLNLDVITFRGDFAIAIASFSDRDVGFRVVHLVPEPGTALLLMMSVSMVGSRCFARALPAIQWLN